MRAVLTTAALLLTAATAQAQTVFLRGAPDVPIPPLAVEDAASPVVLDGQVGRYTVSFVAAAIPWTDHMAFYEESLPQLGWLLLERTGTTLRYQRGRDRLGIRFVDSLDEGELVIIFELESAPASQALD